MFFELYWTYMASGILIYLTARLFLHYFSNKTSDLVELEEQTPDRVAEVKEGKDEEMIEEDEWNPSLENVEHIPLNFEMITPEESLEKSKQFYELMNKRRTIRYFDSKPFPKEIIYNAIKTAGTSPSGAHTEPWTFVLVSSAPLKSEIRDIIEKEEEINYCKRMGKVWTTDLKPFRTNWIKNYLTEAPYLILIFKQIYSYRTDGKKKLHYYNEESVCIATGLLLAAIHQAGLASLISTPLNCGPALRTLLNRPMNEKLITLMPVGYPTADCLVPGLKRKELCDIMVEF